MSKPNLTLLEGGKSLPVSKMNISFLSAYVTDTRLMGVLAVCARWRIVPPTADTSDPDSGETLHQFFYIDCEESGFETCDIVRGDTYEADRLEQSIVGGLGAAKIDLSERETRLLIQRWARFNRDRGIPMPPGPSNYAFLLKPALIPTPEEAADLMEKICTEIVSDAQLVNYFLMRCFGQDYEGARWLTSSGAGQPPVSSPRIPQDVFPLDLYSSYRCATFCRNEITPGKVYGDGSAEYICESLIEMDGLYDTVISKVVVSDLEVIGLEHINSFPITETESALILKKTEFVTVCEVFLSEKDLDDNIDEFILSFHATASDCENGRLFMVFRDNNDHVDSFHFQLSNDVKGLYFLTDHSQLILCAYSREDIRELEKTIAGSILSPYIIPSARYEFPEPILYEFMQSDFEHFETFLEMLRDDD